jgi:transcriptional regulator with XRE-family HTH domain
MARRRNRIEQAKIVSGFAERLRSLRAARGLTQRHLADKADVTTTYISKLEAGGAAPGIDLLERLSIALGVKVSALLPAETAPPDGGKDEVRKLFEAVLAASGIESLSLLKGMLERLKESRALSR